MTSRSRPRTPTLLVVSQVYVPDPASVGQHMADAAEEMARRGYRVLVYTSARGYDDPATVYPKRETRGGVEIRRLPLSSFGKSSIPVRLLAQSLFLAQAILRGALTRGLSGVLVSTSPPFAGIAGVLLGKLRRVPVTYWVMDLNPDQIVALGKISSDSLAARTFDAINRAILRQASDVVVLDRFMAERVFRKLDVRSKTIELPPWPHEDKLETVPHADNPFRREHGLEGKFVLMYSGNHSPANPIDTLLDAAERLQDETALVVVSVGGGAGKKDVEDRIARGARNVRSLPYQPFDRIRFSLSAADVHVVSIGNDVVGIVHPCKVYGAMAVSRPILFIGPSPSHVSDLIDEHRIGWRVAHGDVAGMVSAIREMLATTRAELDAMGRRAGRVVAEELGRDVLLRRFGDVVHKRLPAPGGGAD